MEAAARATAGHTPRVATRLPESGEQDARIGGIEADVGGAGIGILAENTLDDGFYASPAIVGSDLYLRGRRFLYALSRSVGD